MQSKKAEFSRVARNSDNRLWGIEGRSQRFFSAAVAVRHLRDGRRLVVWMPATAPEGAYVRRAIGQDVFEMAAENWVRSCVRTAIRRDEMAGVPLMSELQRACLTAPRQIEDVCERILRTTGVRSTGTYPQSVAQALAPVRAHTASECIDLFYAILEPTRRHDVGQEILAVAEQHARSAVVALAD